MDKITWTKTGGHDQSRTIIYTADRSGFEIIRTRIAGSWTLPGLYQNGRHVRAYLTVTEAKAAAEALIPPGKPLIDILD